MYLKIIISAVFSAYCFFVFIDASAIFQQCGYKYRDYSLWLKKSGKRRFAREVFSIAVILMLFALKALLLLDLISYAVLYSVCLYLCAYLICGSINLRVKPKFTFRFIRIVFLAFLFVFALSYLTDSAGVAIFGVEASYSAIVLPLYPYLIAFSALILSPYEKFRFKTSVKACKRRLAKRRGLIKIGITGSCGKTSVKNYLAEMLAFDYKAYATPKSYNTPLGVCIAVKNMPKDTEVFIVEMGARRRGDIAFLADMVKPDMAIITAVCEQHMETFSTIENIKNAKYELIEGLSKTGTAIFSGDNEHTVSLYEKTVTRKISAGICGLKVSAQDISITGGGTDFNLVIGGVKYFVSTKLLGRHSVTDICLAAAAATELGVKPARIVAAVSRLKPPPHRLELSETDGGITIIDDGYNANLDGVKSAAEVLNEFDGVRYAVVSGIAEGGEYTRTLNEKVGETLKNSVDCLIAVGAYSEHIAKGAQDGKCKVVKSARLCEAESYLKDKVKRGDVVIFINDLPDKYL